MNTLSSIAVSPFGLFIRNSEANSRNTLYRGSIRGLQYCSVPNMYHHLSSGCELLIVRERNNLFDGHAIAIYYKQFKLGFIAATDNQVLANLLDSGKQFKSELAPIKRAKFQPPTELEIIINEH